MIGSVCSRPAITALSALRLLDRSQEQTQSRVATGLRVGAAEHNAAYWSISATMRSNRDMVSTVRDSLGLSLAAVDAACAVAEPVLNQLDGILQDLIQGRSYNPVTSRKLDTDILQRAATIASLITAASFNGVNLLYRPVNKPTSLEFVAGIDMTGSTASAVTIKLDLKAVTLIDGDPNNTNFGILSRRLTDPGGVTSGRSLFSNYGPHLWQIGLFPSFGTTTNMATPFTTAGINAHIHMVNQMMNGARDAFATLGALKARLLAQQAQAGNQLATLDKGIGALVDADMTDESTRLKAIEVQRQLALRSLAISAEAVQTKLLLFRA